MSVARYKWQCRLQALWELARNLYMTTPLFCYLRDVESEHGVYPCIDTLFEMVAVDAGKLLEGSKPEAKLLRKLVQLVERGEYQLVGADLEGEGAKAHELGVVSRDQNGKVKVLVNEDNNDLPKNIPTGRKGRGSHRRPALVSNKLYKLLAKMRTVTDMASGENVMCFHYGGRERELLKALGVPDDLFHDALRIIRYILGAKMNGQFPPNVPYGDQLRTASTGVRSRPSRRRSPRRACRSFSCSSSRAPRRIPASTTPTSPAGCSRPSSRL
jgi:hypothetical protein